MYTVSLSQHGNSTDLQSFAILDEARAFTKKERNQNEEHPDFRGAEWTISDDNGACWPTERATTFTVAFEGDNWTFFPDGAEIPDNWTVWATGLSWEEAHDAING